MPDALVVGDVQGRRSPEATIGRRAWLAGALAACCRVSSTSGQHRTPFRSDTLERLRALERRSEGRLGVAALDVTTGVRVAYRADERFAMCSTFKVLAVGLVLTRVAQGQERLDRQVTVNPADIVPFSPITEAAQGTRLTLGTLCEVAITHSDNTATNLLLSSFGGPAALTAFARGLGDRVTRLDRVEVALNDVPPGDVRDTTSPAAMLENVRQLVLGDRLDAASRSLLTGWLIANTRAHGRLRAGFPPDWRIADKPGTGAHGATNDVAVVWRPDGGAQVVAAYFRGTALDEAERDAVIADVGRVLSS